MDSCCNKKNRRSICPQPLLTKVLVGVIHAAAGQIHPSVFQQIVRAVAAKQGRLAASLRRQTYGLAKQCRHPAHPECLHAIAEQCGWRLQVTAESDDALRIAILEGECAASHESGSYLCELVLGLFTGIAAELFGYAKVGVNQCSETPPVGCDLTIYLRESAENLAIPGVVHSPIKNELVLLGKGMPEGAPDQCLTRRELQVLRLIAQGLPDRKIATALRLSVRTVENHGARIRKKLRIGNRAALVRYALRSHLVDP